MSIKITNAILSIVIGLNCHSFFAQQANKTPLRTFVHTRGTQDPIVDSWTEDGVVHFHDLTQGKVYHALPSGLEKRPANRPALPPDTKGVLKLRRDVWWLLVPERGQLPKDHVSCLLRFDPKEKQWIRLHDLSIRASNFEPLPDNSIFLAGTYSPETGRRNIAAILSPSGSLSQIDEIPFKNFEEMFWQNCLTTLNDETVFVYFPYPGNMYGYDLKTHTLRGFKTPWPLITSESIKKDQEAAGGKDCFISAVGHPGAAHCYFVPANPGQMAFVYKCLDEEQEKALAFPDGKRPLVEKVSSFMMYGIEPNQVFELDTPSRMQLERWYWNPSLGKFYRWEDAMAPKKPPVKVAVPAPKPSSKPQSRTEAPGTKI